MRQQLRDTVTDFVLAWQLLTVVPLPISTGETNRPAGPAALFYPLVGLLLGGLLAASGELLFWLLPPGLAAAVLLALWVGLTGMLHLDGFMDSCDGLLPPRSPERRLEIMKDSRVGAFGVVGAVLLLLVKFNGLLALPAAGRWQVLLVAPLLARWALVWAMARYPLARSQGMSNFFVSGLTGRRVILASVGTLLAATVLLGWRGLLLAALTGLVTWLLARFALARIGGLTGDVYGAIAETVEAALLVAAAVLLAQP
ncbi:MAG: adenosylcobinamide-GDP ribazoletransferase [Anaerolineae bacterium]